MTEGKHTPGPWVSHRGREIIGSNGQQVVLSSQFDTRPTGWEDEIDANTELAMAAPDMWAALRDLAALYEADEGCRRLPEYRRAREILDRLAKGETP